MEIEITKALRRSDLKFIDVRTPDEYRESSIPGAVNIPLFDNREFRQLGIIYRQLGEAEARRAGLIMAAPRLAVLTAMIDQACAQKKPLLYCSRGGLRSLSLDQILTLAGVESFRLKRGYREYRKYVNRRLSGYGLNSRLFVVHGLTGVGKTAVLHKLEQFGLPVIDLEGLASHRGSVFGAIGLDAGRSQKDFDALLLQQLDRFSSEPYLFIEGEGRRIGNIYLPPFLSEAMIKGTQILLSASMEARVERIVSTYIPAPVTEELLEQLKCALASLQRRMGIKKVKELTNMLEEGDFRSVAKLLCADYYDRMYSDSRPECSKFDIVIDAENTNSAAEKIRELAGKVMSGPAI